MSLELFGAIGGYLKSLQKEGNEQLTPRFFNFSHILDLSSPKATKRYCSPKRCPFSMNTRFQAGTPKQPVFNGCLVKQPFFTDIEGLYDGMASLV